MLSRFLRRLLAEPLAQFLLMGGLIFGAWRLVHQPQGDPRRIVIAPQFVEGLRQDSARRTGTQPTQAELQGLIDSYIDDEVLYRQALALGLDRGDVIVRRRLIEKMEFLTEDTSEHVEPTDADLSRWVSDHRDQFFEPTRFSFEHQFFDPKRHPTPGTEADPFPGGSTWKLRSEAEIAATFGAPFATQVVKLEAGAPWSASIPSAFGLHRVRVTGKIDGHMPPLDDVRQRARQGWLSAHREETTRKALTTLRAKYTIERPTLPTPPVQTARSTP